MLGKIIQVLGDTVRIKLETNLYDLDNIMGKNVIFEENEIKIVGEILEGDTTYLDINLIGEMYGGKFIYGSIVKPSFRSICRIITTEELDIIYQNDPNTNSISMGSSVIYNNYRISLDVNAFFSNHFAILGNSGSGKSWGTARVIQSIFEKQNTVPYRASIFIFDAYGEYHSAFKNISEKVLEASFKSYTTNTKLSDSELLKLPLWLLSVDDFALLLNAESASQIPFIEKALKYVNLFTRDESEVIEEKNDIIARALLDILSSGKGSAQIRDQIFSILTTYNTKDLNERELLILVDL